MVGDSVWLAGVGVGKAVWEVTSADDDFRVWGTSQWGRKGEQAGP